MFIKEHRRPDKELKITKNIIPLADYSNIFERPT